MEVNLHVFHLTVYFLFINSIHFRDYVCQTMILLDMYVMGQFVKYVSCLCGSLNYILEINQS